MHRFREFIAYTMVVCSLMYGVFGGQNRQNSSEWKIFGIVVAIFVILLLAALIHPASWGEIKVWLGLVEVEVEEAPDPVEDPDPFDYWQQDLDANPWRPDPDWSDRFRS